MGKGTSRAAETVVDIFVGCVDEDLDVFRDGLVLLTWLHYLLTSPYPIVFHGVVRVPVVISTHLQREI
jgi:hypothetical protein